VINAIITKAGNIDSLDEAATDPSCYPDDSLSSTTRSLREYPVSMHFTPLPSVSKIPLPGTTQSITRGIGVRENAESCRAMALT
jgi:hypothetical protein